MRKRIIFRVDGYKELGLGHVYNCISLAEMLDENDIMFLTTKNFLEGYKKLRGTRWDVTTISDSRNIDEIDKVINIFNPDIWVNDCLNTEVEYVEKIKKKVKRYISIEDIGEGADKADAVINAMYEEDNRLNVYSGWKYACLRKEFLDTKPSVFREHVANVIIMFGGTDPSNYNKMLYKVIEEIGNRYTGIHFNFITGFGYDADLNGIVTCPEKNIFVYSNVEKVSEYMKEADIAITSQGRTIFELAAMGVPSIVLSQNEREQTHTFAQMDHGFLNLGLKDVSANLVKNTLDWLINTPPIRRNMYDLMTCLSIREGVERVKKIILNEDE